MRKYYHGTSPSAAESILANGFQTNPDSRRDAGDFGAGLYLTTMLSRAKSYGQVVLEVMVDVERFAFIPNPYFIDRLERVEPVTEQEKLMHSLVIRDGEMLTCYGAERNETAQRVREVFLQHGYQGIVSEYQGDETVVFDTQAIVNVNVKE